MILMRLPYLRALAVTKSICAVLFVFLPGKNGDRFTLDACTGWVRHMGRFYESRTYAFALDVPLSAGDAEVYLLDEKKQPLLKLSKQFPYREIALDGKYRYYLHWEFRSASGKCALRW